MSHNQPLGILIQAAQHPIQNLDILPLRRLRQFVILAPEITEANPTSHSNQ